MVHSSAVMPEPSTFEQYCCSSCLLLYRGHSSLPINNYKTVVPNSRARVLYRGVAGVTRRGDDNAGRSIQWPFHEFRDFIFLPADLRIKCDHATQEPQSAAKQIHRKRAPHGHGKMHIMLEPSSLGAIRMRRNKPPSVSRRSNVGRPHVNH